MATTDELVRVQKDVTAEHPITVEVDNDVEGWKAIAWGKRREAGEVISFSVQVALRKAYAMGCDDQKAVCGNRPEGPATAVEAEE